jgi:hypothetical protein
MRAFEEGGASSSELGKDLCSPARGQLHSRYFCSQQVTPWTPLLQLLTLLGHPWANKWPNCNIVLDAFLKLHVIMKRFLPQSYQCGSNPKLMALGCVLELLR